MTEANIYTATNISYSFSTTPQAYLSDQRLSSTPNPPDPDKIFEYIPYYPLLAVSIRLCPNKLVADATIHATILDQNNIAIPGTEEVIKDITLISKYTFTTPVQAGTPIRFMISSTSGLDSVNSFAYCNATIFG